MHTCGSLSGLSIGDSSNKQPIGIILTVIGVVVLDFCADASEGPIRAYLLDVADTEEQDMALNIHGLSAGRTFIDEDPHTSHPYKIAAYKTSLTLLILTLPTYSEPH